MSFSAFFLKYLPYYWIGVKFTLILSCLSLVFGFLFGNALAFAKISKKKFLSALSTAYIEFFRGTPLMVQLYRVYFGTYILAGLDVNRFLAALIAVSLNSAAYVAEIIRAGIFSIDRGQTEAALSLGLTDKQALMKIVLPQAVKNILPALGNELVTLVKETSIASVIGVTEIMYQSDSIHATTYDFRALTIAAGLYFVLTFGMSKLLGKMERRLAHD